MESILSYVSAEADLSVGYVYKWTNLVNGMMYIGSHCGNNPNYVGNGKRFKRAVKKYGIKNFRRNLLYVGPNFKEVETEILIEINAARKDNQFYNLTNNEWFPSTPLGIMQRSNFEYWVDAYGVEEAIRLEVARRQKISAALSGINNPSYGKVGELSPWFGKKHSAETIAQMSASHSGKPKTAEHKAKLSEAHRGKTLSDEHKQKLSEIGKGRPHEELHKLRLSYSHHVTRHIEKGQKASKKPCEWCAGRPAPI